jgi:hypothetical protein
MNKKNLSLKVDGYTITIHRGPEETEEMKQKRMALYTDCLSKAMRGIVAKHLKGYMPEQQFDIKNIMLENNNERVRSFNCSK